VGGGADALQEALGLLEATLPAAQLSQPDEPVRHLPRPGHLQVAGRRLELGLGLLPGALREQHGGVVRATGREERGPPPLEAELLHALGPLAGAIEVARALAGEDQIATGGPHPDRQAHLAADGGRGRLVELRHPLADVARRDRGQALEAEARHLDVRIAERAPQLRPLVAETARRRRVVLLEQTDLALPDRQPAVLRRRGQPFEQAVRAPEPAVADRRFAPEAEVVDAEQRGKPAGGESVPVAAVEPIGALARVKHRLGVVEPPGGKAQPLERLGTRLPLHRRLEARTCPLPVGGGECLPARRERFLRGECVGGRGHRAAHDSTPAAPVHYLPSKTPRTNLRIGSVFSWHDR
jgi:hypothetical protein